MGVSMEALAVTMSGVALSALHSLTQLVVESSKVSDFTIAVRVVMPLYASGIRAPACYLHACG